MVSFDNIRIVRSHRRSLTINVLSDGVIEVRAPQLMPTFFIKQFVKKHEEWIEKRLLNVPKIKVSKYTDGEGYQFLGKSYVLTLGNYSKIEISERKLLFPIGLKFRIKKELENWYIKQAKEVIKSQTAHYAKEMNTSFTSISFSDTKSKWGSCTHDNRLQFNWRLIMSPLLVLRYVVIHELAHTIEKNHSHSFWARVRAQNPSYKEQIKWLKKHGDSLFI